jgi:glycosyltransferase involved in cell wall biosynthesis
LVNAGRKILVVDFGRTSTRLPNLLPELARCLRAYFVFARALLRNPRSTTVYLTLSGGKGQLFDLFFVACAVLLRRPLTIHHHSFAYLRQPTALARLVFRLAGRKARHIVLCGAMQHALRQAYPFALRIYVLSNAALVLKPDEKSRRESGLRRIGFLSNITLDKGIDRFIDLAAMVRSRQPAIRFHAAGPCQTKELASLMQDQVAQGHLIYHGAVRGDQKTSYFDQIDLLVLPTRYVNEAEPLVILEALAAGVPVAASRRGCISALVNETHGFLLDEAAEDLTPLANKIAEWHEDQLAFAEMSGRALSHYEHLREAALRQCSLIISHMTYRDKDSNPPMS